MPQNIIQRVKTINVYISLTSICLSVLALGFCLFWSEAMQAGLYFSVKEEGKSEMNQSCMTFVEITAQ